MRLWKSLKAILTPAAVLIWSGALFSLSGSIASIHLEGPFRASREGIHAAGTLADIRERSLLMWGLVSQHVAAQSPRERAALAKEIATAEAELADRWRAYERLRTSAGKRAAFLRYRASWLEYVRARKAATSGHRTAGVDAERKSALERSYRQAISHLRQAMTPLDNYPDDQSFAGWLQSRLSRVSPIWLSLAALGLSLSLGRILARVLTRRTYPQTRDQASREPRLIAPARS